MTGEEIFSYTYLHIFHYEKHFKKKQRHLKSKEENEWMLLEIKTKD